MAKYPAISIQMYRSGVLRLASEISQCEMVKILHGLPGVEVYQDDIVVHGATMEEHDDQGSFRQGKNNL